MEEIQQVPNQNPLAPVPPLATYPMSQPALTSKTPWILISLIVTLLGVASYFGYQNFQLKQQLAPQLPTPTPAVISSPTRENDATVDWQTYIAKDNSFTLKYPDGWYQYNNGGTGDSFSVAFSSKPEDSDFGWRSLGNDDFAFSIQVSPNKQTTYNNGWDILQAFPVDKRTIGQQYSDTKEIATLTNKINIDGVEAFEIERTPPSTFEGENYYIREIYFVKNDKIYMLTPFAGKGKS
ncbi:MAG: PsbP-related protein, partial [Candidatus Saccharibacteria bacterium]|nr:PsbP-related protein [Candidatus Saccharibacteria bacterium]